MKWLEELAEYIREASPDRVIVLTDSRVASLLPPLEWDIVTVPEGEASKSLESLQLVWDALAEHGATRQSLLVNVGGGMVSDLGGFAAGTFKRGIRHINVPTTLLAMADAAIGGKTAIDYRGLKNEIGMFKMPERVITDPGWLVTLSPEQLRDGLAEVVKSAMLGSETIYRSILELPDTLTAYALHDAALFSSRFKEDVVARDPREGGVRRILNLGHTAGHAYESLAAQKGVPVSHGHAVAYGLHTALLLSVRLCGLDGKVPEEYAARVLRRHYPPLPVGIEDVDALINLMRSDKKNPRHGMIGFVLLRDIGDAIESLTVVDEEDIRECVGATLCCRTTER